MKSVVALTGRRKAGKDTFARIAHERYPHQVQSIAIADWFKEFLSEVLEVPLEAFYDEKLKGQDFGMAYPINRYTHDLSTGLEQLDHSITAKEHRKNLRAFEDMSFTSPRQAMELFGFSFVSSMYGERFHCAQLASRLLDCEADFVIVTDARVHAQSQYLVDKYRAVPVRITRHAVEKADTEVENATDAFPVGWFKHEIVNPYPSIALYEARVQRVLDEVFGPR